MRPKKHETTGEEDLFRARLDPIIRMKHELVQLAGKLDWTGSAARSRRSTATKAGPGLSISHLVHRRLV
jgi:transposase, IS5 family